VAITVATEDGAVTILPEEQYSSMQKTLKLLADKEDLLTEQEWRIEATKKFLSAYSKEDSIYDQL
jgi:PHD/YefM family antitoxin component YafN of YafNO toxin-antitoxin module